MRPHRARQQTPLQDKHGTFFHLLAANECNFIAFGKHLDKNGRNIEPWGGIGIGHRRFNALVQFADRIPARY
jgi:hypothetical protein